MVGLILFTCWVLKKGEKLFTPRIQHMDLENCSCGAIWRIANGHALLSQFNFINNWVLLTSNGCRCIYGCWFILVQDYYFICNNASFHNLVWFIFKSIAIFSSYFFANWVVVLRFFSCPFSLAFGFGPFWSFSFGSSSSSFVCTHPFNFEQEV